MNFVKRGLSFLLVERSRFLSNIFIIFLCFHLAGCSDQVRLPSAEQLSEFESAGPTQPTVDIDKLIKAKIGGGSYKVVPGDVLELSMPTILQIVTADSLDSSAKISPNLFTPYLCRVGNDGTITLPIVERIQVAGKSLSEIESAIIDAYHPKYIGTRPSVLTRVAEYKKATVSMTGAVEKPGVYELRQDRMSLVALLMEAGGIVDGGAAMIQIIHSDQTSGSEQEIPEATLSSSVEKSAQDPKVDANKQPLGKLSAANNIKPTPSSMIKAELIFKNIDTSNTKGELVVKFDGKVQVFKNCDVANALHRKTVAMFLIEKEPRLSAVNVEQQLSALAEELQAAYTKARVDKTSDKTNLSLCNKPDKNGSENKPISDEALYKQLIDGLNTQRSVNPQRTSLKPNSLKSLVLPVRGLNIPFADVALADGDSVIVERLTLPLFTVIGLVNKPGNFPYQPDVEYNLMQAIAFAGGLDIAADPRYATIYRLKADGTILRAPFQIIDSRKGSKLTESLSVPIKPGDIVAIEHTPRTRTNVFVDKMFRLNIGAYINLRDFLAGQ